MIFFMQRLSDGILNFLCQALASTSFEVLPLLGDASKRKYFRLSHKDDTYVLMLWEPFDPSTYPFLSVQKHFAKHDVKVPYVVDQEAELGVLLLEDLGDLTLERCFWRIQDQQLVIPFYKQALDEVVKIHFRCSNDFQNSCTAFQVSFDKEKLLWEMNYGKVHLLEKLVKMNLSDKDFNHLEFVFEDICTKLDKEPKYICHRDYHSRNLMYHKKEIRVIDFQDARLGPVQYDLVSLFHDSYVSLKPEIIEILIKYYFHQASGLYKKSLPRVDEFQYIFQLQTIQRCFKACGSFASFYNQGGDQRYLKYIHKTIRRIYKILENFPEYAHFREVLTRENLLERHFEDL